MIDAKTLGAMPVGAFQPLGQGGLPNAEVQPGITLRQHFAGLIYTQFLRGSVIPPDFDATEQLGYTAKIACDAADALLTELAKEPQS